MAPPYNVNLCLCVFLLLWILLFMQFIVNSQLILACIQIHFKTQMFRVHKLLSSEAKLLYPWSSLFTLLSVSNLL